MTAVGIHPPTLKPPLGISPFDVRSLGLTLGDDFKASIPFSTCYEIWDKSGGVEAFPEPNGIFRIRLEHTGRRSTDVPQTLWVDESQGFSPVRLSYSLPPTEPGQAEQFMSDCRMRWKEESGVWIPASFRIERRARGRLIEFYTLSFEWISVNKPIPPDLFTAEGLGVPGGTPVIDYRAAVPKRMGQVKELAPPK
jgi:hypothetical protein